MIGIEMKLNIPVHYQMGNPLQKGMSPCDLYIQSYLPRFFFVSPFLKNYKRYHLKLRILVHYQKRNQLQQGR